MFHLRRTLRSSRTTRRARTALQSRPRKLLLASPRRVCIPQVQPEEVLAPWGLVGGARFFRLCLHSHRSAVRTWPLCARGWRWAARYGWYTGAQGFHWRPAAPWSDHRQDLGHSKGSIVFSCLTSCRPRIWVSAIRGRTHRYLNIVQYS